MNYCDLHLRCISVSFVIFFSQPPDAGASTTFSISGKICVSIHGTVSASKVISQTVCFGESNSENYAFLASLVNISHRVYYFSNNAIFKGSQQ